MRIFEGLQNLFSGKPADLFQITQNWKPKKLLELVWDIPARSVNQVPLKSPVPQLEKTFGAPSSTTPTKLSYPAYGLDIFVGEKTRTVVMYYFYIRGNATTKPAPLKAKLSDGTWHTFSPRDDETLMHSFLGTPKETKSLQDGFLEIYVWEDVQIRVFYTLSRTLNLILFSNS